MHFFRNGEEGAEKEQLVQNAADEASTAGNWLNRTHHEEDVNNNPEKFTSHYLSYFFIDLAHSTDTQATQREKAGSVCAWR
jgi:hypothetical protein